MAPNGDRVPANYDAKNDTITFETTPYVSMMPDMNVGDQATMLLEAHYFGPPIRPTWRARLKSSLFRREERQRQNNLCEQMIAKYVSQL